LPRFMRTLSLPVGKNSICWKKLGAPCSEKSWALPRPAETDDFAGHMAEAQPALQRCANSMVLGASVIRHGRDWKHT
jgi:hypothetical protein